MEIYLGTSIPVYSTSLYGNDLKGKLRRDVLTISQQTLTAAQKTQVQDNIGVTEQVAALNSNITSLYQQIGEKATYISGTLLNNGGTITIPRSGVYLLIITSGSDTYKGLLGISASDSGLGVVTYSLGSAITYTTSGMNIQFTFSATRNTRFCLTRMGNYVTG